MLHTGTHIRQQVVADVLQSTYFISAREELGGFVVIVARRAEVVKPIV